MKSAPGPLSLDPQAATSAGAPVIASTRKRLQDIPRTALYALLAWLVVALLIAANGLFVRVIPLVPLTLVGLVGGSILAWRRSPALREWTAGLDLRVPISLHVVRIFFGTLFLVDLAAGRLPAVFAERGGYGDILAGALAIVAVFAAGRVRPQANSRVRRWILWLFSWFGLADILLVFVTAQVTILVDKDPLLIAALGQLPYALLPSVVVPLVILTHLLVMQRLRAAAT